MENTLHDRIAGRDASAAESGNGTPAAEAGMDLVTVCAWCQGSGSINVLSLPSREADVILIFRQGRQLTISRNGIPLKITHGICPSCRAQAK
jgi:hypothetical protein